eukprot:844597-Prymnesium_polylepis.1
MLCQASENAAAVADICSWRGLRKRVSPSARVPKSGASMAKKPPCPEASCRKHSALSAKQAANAAAAQGPHRSLSNLFRGKMPAAWTSPAAGAADLAAGNRAALERWCFLRLLGEGD